MLTKLKKLNKVGIELEGGWRSKPNRWKSDGSVSGCAPNQGELASLPMATMATIKRFMLTKYPDRNNETCGMHVHISTNNLMDYRKLTDVNFWEFFRSKMLKFSETLHGDDYDRFMKRYDGIYYCMPSFKPGSQIRGNGDRYTQLNFCAYHAHGTLEIRLLPMFSTKEIALDAVLYLLGVFEEYLGYDAHLVPFTVEEVANLEEAETENNTEDIETMSDQGIVLEHLGIFGPLEQITIDSISFENHETERADTVINEFDQIPNSLLSIA